MGRAMVGSNDGKMIGLGWETKSVLFLLFPFFSWVISIIYFFTTKNVTVQVGNDGVIYQEGTLVQQTVTEYEPVWTGEHSCDYGSRRKQCVECGPTGGEKSLHGNKKSPSLNLDLLTMAIPGNGHREIHFLLHIFLWFFFFIYDEHVLF